MEARVREIGIRELKEKTSEVLRRVREAKEAYTITYRGRAVARLLPVDRRIPRTKEEDGIWAEMDELAEEIGREWPAGVSAVDAVREQRR
jgi:prevent-host-death family protein